MLRWAAENGCPWRRTDVFINCDSAIISDIILYEREKWVLTSSDSFVDLYDEEKASDSQ